MNFHKDNIILFAHPLLLITVLMATLVNSEAG